MYKILSNYLLNKFLSRWVVLAFDIVVVAVTFHIAYLIRFGFDFVEVEEHISILQTAMVVGLYAVFFFVTKSFSGIIRYSGVEDAAKIIRASMIAGIVVFLLSVIILRLELDNMGLHIPKGVIIIHSLIVLMVLLSSRMFVREVFKFVQTSKDKSVNIAIYGAGYVGVITSETLNNDKNTNYNITCFIDDNEYLHKKRLYGYKIEGPRVVLTKKYILKEEINEIVIAINSLERSKRNEIVDKCLEIGVKVRIIPSSEKWVNGELSASQIKEVNIEDLLERPAIVIDNHKTIKEITDEVILVTGAAGSIGSEIVRQLITKTPSKIVLFEQAESPLHDLRIDLGANLCKKYPEVEFKFIIGDIRDEDFVDFVFKTHLPKIVYHAAAYKHVPLMEEYPAQAISTNVKGTKNIADASVKYGVDKFVMVSTDKAVNPTNVMGASKRIAEIYIQSLSTNQKGTKFITTRFGNVLGSNGSVIPMFKKQIAVGGPLTVTHKDITRYFMTIPEACQLVLEAGTMGKGGEIFIFDMGKSVKVFDIAKKMIQLSGYVYPEDINIVFSGLRPGEKLYEELLASKEGTVPTYHPKIMVAKIRDVQYLVVSETINDLILSIGLGEVEIVRRMKELVPEFISNNSRFEKLDKKQEQEA